MNSFRQGAGTGMRYGSLAAALAAFLALAGCVSDSEATQWRNPATGEVRAGCGPYQGLQWAVDEAVKACSDEFVEEGWVKQ